MRVNKLFLLGFFFSIGAQAFSGINSGGPGPTFVWDCMNAQTPELVEKCANEQADSLSTLPYYKGPYADLVCPMPAWSPDRPSQRVDCIAVDRVYKTQQLAELRKGCAKAKSKLAVWQGRIDAWKGKHGKPVAPAHLRKRRNYWRGQVKEKC